MYANNRIYDADFNQSRDHIFTTRGHIVQPNCYTVGDIARPSRSVHDNFMIWRVKNETLSTSPQCDTSRDDVLLSRTIIITIIVVPHSVKILHLRVGRTDHAIRKSCTAEAVMITWYMFHDGWFVSYILYIVFYIFMYRHRGLPNAVYTYAAIRPFFFYIFIRILRNIIIMIRAYH